MEKGKKTQKSAQQSEPKKRIESTSNILPSSSSPSEERCPICNAPFPSSMTLLQRTHHVEQCLDHPQSNEISPLTSRDLEDDLWESEEPASSSRRTTPSPSPRQRKPSAKLRVDVRGKSHHVLVDDGDEAFYTSLVASYLSWRQLALSQSPLTDEALHKFQNLASALNDWNQSLASSLSPSKLQKQLKSFYLSEPALLLPSGHAVPSHLWEVLYPYQQKGVQWMLKLHGQLVGGIIADEMGLGKTIQIIVTLIVLKFTSELRRAGRDLLSLPLAEKDFPPNAAESLHLNESNRPSLIIVPATLLGHWIRELHRWCPLLRSVVLHNSSQSVLEGETLASILQQSEEQQKKNKNRYDVIITTYEGFRKSSLYRRTNWFYAVLDEGGKIKNAKVTIAQECKKLRTVHRVLISGTPLQNNLKELWSLIDFVFPGRLGTLEAFVSAFVVPISRGIYSNASAKAANLGYQCSLILQDSISPYILRRLKKVDFDIVDDNQDVKKELPPKTEQVLSCLLSPEQEKCYLEYLKSDLVQASLIGRSMPFKAIIRLRQICNHPVFFRLFHTETTVTNPIYRSVNLRHTDGMFYQEESPKDDPTGLSPTSHEVFNDEAGDSEMDIDFDAVDWRESSKMIVMNEVLHIWKKEGHKVLIYTQTVSMLTIIMKYVEEQHFSYCMMDGSTPVVKRQALVDLFNSDPTIFLFLLTTRVGGLGINLVGADRVILFDPDWNPSVDIQARERCWRIGQQRPVTIYRLITSGTIEEKIYHRQIFKTVLSNRVLGEGNDLCSFTSTNLNDLFTYTKRERGTETGEIFPEGEILPDTQIPAVVDQKPIDEDSEEESAEGGDKVIACLFNHGELKSVFNHEYAFNNTDVVTMSRMDREARQEAEELQRQLRESRDQYAEENPMMANQIEEVKERNREAELSSAEILKRLKQRRPAASVQTEKKEISPSHLAMANQILHYFRVRKDHKASTDNVVSYFKNLIKNDDKYLFRRLLKSFARLKNDVWTLNPEWQCSVCSENHVPEACELRTNNCLLCDG